MITEQDLPDTSYSDSPTGTYENDGDRAFFNNNIKEVTKRLSDTNRYVINLCKEMKVEFSTLYSPLCKDAIIARLHSTETPPFDRFVLQMWFNQRTRQGFFY